MHRYLPPPLFVLLLAGAMWLTARHSPLTVPTFPGQIILAIGIAVLGLALMVVAAWQFHRSRTTINPARPEKSERLVADGLYAYSRNPMYMGDLILLLAWAVYLGDPINLIWPAIFVWIMNRVQIRSEERALAAHFGEPYRRYCERVRRWF